MYKNRMLKGKIRHQDRQSSQLQARVTNLDSWSVMVPTALLCFQLVIECTQLESPGRHLPLTVTYVA